MSLIELILGGGATGLLGTIFSQISSYVDKRAERKFILDKYRLDAELRSKEMENEKAVAETKGYTEGLVASYNQDASYGSASLWVVNILRLIRPAITLALWGLVGWIFYDLNKQMSFDELPWIRETAMKIKGDLISAIIYCAITATLWWFGTRDMRKTKL